MLWLSLDANPPVWNTKGWLQRNSESEPLLVSAPAMPLKAAQLQHFTPHTVCASLYLASPALIATYAWLNKEGIFLCFSVSILTIPVYFKDVS